MKIKTISIGLRDEPPGINKSMIIQERVNEWLEGWQHIKIISTDVAVMSETHVIYIILYEDD